MKILKLIIGTLVGLALLTVTIRCEGGVGVREVAFFNPLPSTYKGIVNLNLNFAEGEAYNGTIRVFDELGREVPFQLLDCSLYTSGYYRSCKLMILANVPGMGVSKYTVTYLSSPPPLNVSIQGLIVTLSNLTLTLFNVTGSYVVNLTDAITIKGPGYTAIFSNLSLAQLKFDGVAANLVYYDWPFTGFVLASGEKIIANGYDLKNCSVSLVVNGSLVSVVKQVCRGGGFELRQNFTFTGVTSTVKVDSLLRLTGNGTLYYPYLRIPALGINEVQANEILYTLERARSFVPAPRWLALKINDKWLGVLVNYTSIRLSQYLGELNSTLRNLYANETRPAIRSKYLAQIKTLSNMSRLFLARERLPEANLTALLLEAEQVKSSMNYHILLSNLTSLIEEPEGISRRLILVPGSDSLNVIYQVNRTPLEIRTSVLLGVFEDPDSWARSLLYSDAIGVTAFYAPIASRLTVPATAFVDDILLIRVDIVPARTLKNVTIELIYPRNAFKLLEGAENINVTAISAPKSYEWILQAIYEGVWTVSVNVTGGGGSLLASREVNVSLPSLVPGFQLVSRSFNLTVTCVDLNGKPLSGYALNLYDNSTKKLIFSEFVNESGRASFLNITSGVYVLEVTDGIYSSMKELYVLSNRNVTVTIARADLKISVELEDGTPLVQTPVYVRDINGSLVCIGFTNSSGVLTCKALPLGDYTISVRWRGGIAGYTSVTLRNDSSVTIRGVVRRVTVAVSLAGKPATGAIVEVYTVGGSPVSTATIDENGLATFYLLPGPYKFVATKGQYTAGRTTDIRAERFVELKLEVSLNLWLLIVVTVVLWVLTVYIWYRRTSYIYREKERYRRLLQRLEELYSRGEVEEKYYLKLRQEYEEKLNKLSRVDLV
ncbi:MAG: hypothetical protein QXY49_01025 [Thermofilaceae archaeon]